MEKTHAPRLRGLTRLAGIAVLGLGVSLPLLACARLFP